MQFIRFYAIITSIFVAFCIGAFHFKYYKNTHFKYFIYYLSYSFLGELISLYLIENNRSGSIIIYNLYSIVTPVFLTFFFRYYMRNKLYRKISGGLLGLFLMSVILNSIYYQDFVSTIQNNTWILENFTIVAVIILYMFDLLRSDAVLKLKKLPHFWIAVGYFLFGLCFIPVLVIGRFIQWTGVFDYILLGGNLINVFCMIKAFLVTRENFKDESSVLI